MRGILIGLAFLIAGGIGFGAYWMMNYDGGAPDIPETPIIIDSNIAVDQLVPVNAQIKDIIWSVQDEADKKSDTDLKAIIDARLEKIAQQNGASSLAFAQATSEAALLLNGLDKNNLAIPYMETALALHREILGSEHRATALVMHDLSSLKASTGDQEQLLEAIQLLSEAVVVRRAVLDETHVETAGGLAALGDQLYTYWLHSPEDSRDDKLLDEASAASLDAVNIYEANEMADLLDYHMARIRLGQIAYEKEDYQAAANILSTSLPLVDDNSDFSFLFIFERAYTAYMNTLRKLDRNDEADTLQDAINAKLALVAGTAQTEAQTSGE